PVVGALGLAASALFLSSFGLPVSGSFGSLSQTMFPHSAPPQFSILMRERPFSVSQVPRGSAKAGPPSHRPNRASAIAPARKVVIIKCLPICTSFTDSERAEAAHRRWRNWGDRAEFARPGQFRTNLLGWTKRARRAA